MVNDNLTSVVNEGATLLSQLADTDAKNFLAHICSATSPVVDRLCTATQSPDLTTRLDVVLRIGAVVPHEVGGGGVEMAEMLKEGRKLLSELPSPHARGLLQLVASSQVMTRGDVCVQ